MSRAHWDDLVAHARESSPDECCGYARVRDGRFEEVFRGENEYESPRYGYNLDGRSLHAANELDDAGYDVAVYHSHPRSAAEPSQTDINIANYPHWTYVIISLAGDPDVRAWHIRDGGVREEAIEVE